MPYTNVPDHRIPKMDSCVTQVMKEGKPKAAAIAICYTSIVGKKVLLSPYPIEDIPVGDLIPPGENKAVCWGCLEGDESEWAQRQLARRNKAIKRECSVSGCGCGATQLIAVKGQLLFYCDEHVRGAVDVLGRHHLTIDGIKSAEQIEVLPKADSGKKGYTTCILALKVPEHVSQHFLFPDGEPAEEHHVTLVFLGETADLNREELTTIARGLAASLHPFTAKMDGVIKFDEGAVAVNVDSPYIPEMRQQLVDTLQGLGYRIQDVHGFTPHMTLAYTEPDAPIPDVPKFEDDVSFEELWLFWNGEQQAFPMLAQGKKEETFPINSPVEGEELEEAVKAAAVGLDALAKAISDKAKNKKITPEIVRNAILEPWFQTVFGTPASNQLQKVASRTFGFPDPPGTEELNINWALLYAMGEMYNLTQEFLLARGFREEETVPVYHPYMPRDATPKQWKKGDEVRIKLLPLSSWTLDIREASKVADTLSAPGSPAFVLKTFIPIKSVVSTPNTGVGLPGTQEVVLAGGEYEALVEIKYE